MATMKAALYDGEGAMRLADVARPVPGPGDALIRVRASGICGSDLLVNWERTTPDERPAGHEVAGEIVEVGEGADRGGSGNGWPSRPWATDWPALIAGTAGPASTSCGPIKRRTKVVASPSI